MDMEILMLDWKCEVRLEVVALYRKNAIHARKRFNSIVDVVGIVVGLC